MTTSTFKSDRIFYQSLTNGQENGWFFCARESMLFGPFEDKDTATQHLEIFIGDCLKRKDTGGRNESRYFEN